MTSKLSKRGAVYGDEVEDSRPRRKRKQLDSHPDSVVGDELGDQQRFLGHRGRVFALQPALDGPSIVGEAVCSEHRVLKGLLCREIKRLDLPKVEHPVLERAIHLLAFLTTTAKLLRISRRTEPRTVRSMEKAVG